MIDERTLEGHMGVSNLWTLERASRQRTRFHWLGWIGARPAPMTNPSISRGSSHRTKGRGGRSIILDGREVELDSTQCYGAHSARQFICDNI